MENQYMQSKNTMKKQRRTTIETGEFIKNTLLAEPITVKGRIAMASVNKDIKEKEFFEKIYVKPFTLYEYDETDTIRNEKLDKVSDPDKISGFDYTDKVKLNRLKNIQGTFEERLKALSDALYIVKGGSGAGKTTYVHRLNYLYSDIIKFDFCDFEEASQAIVFLDQRFDFKEKYTSNVWKFISLITA